MAHNSWPPHAHQLLCKRTTAVVRPEILTVSTTYSISSNNIYYLFHQQEEDVSSTYDTSSFLGILFTYYLDGSLLSQQVRSFNIWS
ncbi:hypothetical protein F7D81_03895 [Prevotella copri]|nr:hypothetical protein [Segatella copri]MQN49688.1 hypothetical protein [Segatella copri]MQN51326.1 hypothetical protein [Segatella copri]MQN57681.1 hypothetical protein [Segatella copri]MQN92197.1 hypothetical protein [Segatella copri]